MHEIKACTSTLPWSTLVAIDMQVKLISQTAMTLAVVFKLLSSKQEKIIVIGLHCVHTNLVFTEAFKKPNPVFSWQILGLGGNTATSKAVHQILFRPELFMTRCKEP